MNNQTTDRFFDEYSKELDLLQEPEFDNIRNKLEQPDTEWVAYRIGSRPAHNAMLFKELEKNNIAWIPTMTNMITIDRKDFCRVQELDQECFTKEMNYSVVLTEEGKLKNAVANTPSIQNKELLVVQNQNKAFLALLEKKCGEISLGYLMEVTDSKQNGIDHADVMVRADKILLENRNDFCRAYLSAQMHYFGNNHSWYYERYQQNEKLKEALEDRMEREEDSFVYDPNEPKGYLKITTDGYEQYQLEDGEFLPVKSKSVEDENYFLSLERCLSEYKDRELLPKESEVRKELLELDEIGEELKEDRRMNILVVHETVKNVDRLADVIDEQTRNCLSKYPEGELTTPERIFSAYQKESKALICGLVEKEMPEREDSVEERKTEDSIHEIIPPRDELNAALEKIRQERLKIEELRTVEGFLRNSQLSCFSEKAAVKEKEKEDFGRW